MRCINERIWSIWYSIKTDVVFNYPLHCKACKSDLELEQGHIDQIWPRTWLHAYLLFFDHDEEGYLSLKVKSQGHYSIQNARVLLRPDLLISEAPLRLTGQAKRQSSTKCRSCTKLYDSGLMTDKKTRRCYQNGRSAKMEGRFGIQIGRQQIIIFKFNPCCKQSNQ